MECLWIFKFTHGRETYSSSEGVIADVRELPFDAGTFDVAFDKGQCTPFPRPPYQFGTFSQGQWTQ